MSKPELYKIERLDARLDNPDKVFELVQSIARDCIPETSLEEIEESNVDQKLAAQLKEQLDVLTGSVWSVIVGSKFSVSAGQHKDDQYAQFKVGPINVILLETKLKR